MEAPPPAPTRGGQRGDRHERQLTANDLYIADRPVSASSRRNQPFGFMSKLRHWTNGLQSRMAPVDGIGGLVSVGLGGPLCIIMGGWFEQHTYCVAAQSPSPVAPLSPSRLPSKGP